MGKGFFWPAKNAITQTANLDPTRSAVSCADCGLRRKCNSPCMQAYGEGEKKILIVGEHPSTEDDTVGRPFAGKSGEMLQQELKQNRIDLLKDCRMINAVNCLSKKDPTKLQIDACRPYVWAEIQKFKPKLILALGSAAVESLVGQRFEKGAIFMFQANQIPDAGEGGTNAWICPTFHPSHMFTNKGDNVMSVLFKKDVREAINKLGASIPTVDIKSVTTKEAEVMDRLKLLKEHLYLDNHAFVSLDYETTGLKPHAKGHRILCAGITSHVTGAVALTLEENTNDLKHQLLCDILSDPNVALITGNELMEMSWTRWCLGLKKCNWTWDVVLAAHILDNRGGVANVKWQSFVQLGVPDYTPKSVKDKISAEYGNDFNRMEEVPVNELLTYCAIDGLVEYHLAAVQMERMGYVHPNRKFGKIEIFYGAHGS